MTYEAVIEDRLAERAEIKRLQEENSAFRKKLIQMEIRDSMRPDQNKTQSRISNHYLDYAAPLIWNPGTFEKCDAWLQHLREEYDFAPGTVMTRDGPIPEAKFRNNTRLEIWDQEIADKIWFIDGPGKSGTPHRIHDYAFAGVSEYVRVYRYQPGQYFKPHLDHSWRENDFRRSLVTILIYLNDGFTGGETTFLDYNRVLTPEKGMMVAFQHPVLHEGKEVTSGEKYVLRLDLMYEKESA